MTLRIGEHDSLQHRTSVKRQQAEERKAAWDALSLKEKIECLDRRLGKGLGAKKQRQVLSEKLDKNKFSIKSEPKPAKESLPIEQKSKPTDQKPKVAAATPTPQATESDNSESIIKSDSITKSDSIITIFKSSDGDKFIAKIKGIKDTASGSTKAEARANARKLIKQQSESE